MKLAFVHIPKTAGGTVKHWFKNNTNNVLINEGHIFLKDFTQNYDCSFCITRNTYYRFISLYEFSTQMGAKKLLKRQSKGKLSEEEEMDLLKSIKYQKQGIVPWLEYCKSQNSISVANLLDWIDGVDIVLRQENLQEDFKKIQEMTNCHKPLEYTRHVLNYDPKKYLTKNYIDFINEYWKEELDYFGYKL